MTRTQIQFPDPLYIRLKEIAELNDWSLADVVRRATELYVRRFPEPSDSEDDWSFPTLDMGGAFLRDPASSEVEAEAIELRSE
jgi:hypothetical protein